MASTLLLSAPHPQMHAITPNCDPFSRRLHNPQTPPFHASFHACLPTTTTPTSTTTTTPTSPNLTLPPTQNPTLRSTWSHRAWVAAGSTTVVFPLAKSISAASESGNFLPPLFSALLGYILADLGTGVYHWAVDNYGNPSTPVFGSLIKAFQGHHKSPWPITKRQFANIVHPLARGVTFIAFPIDLLVGIAGDDAAVNAFMGVFSGCVMMCQQFHGWAHGTKSKLPEMVVALQDCGVLVSRGKHSTHHRPPYNTNYCIVSGVWNELLDGYKVFEAMEMVIFFKFGVRPRSWSETEVEWLEDTYG